VPKQKRAPGKGGALTGGALSEETINSSTSVLRPTRPGASRRGLQQFFTPPAAATLIKSVIAPQGEGPVLDLTAGSGTLLAPWPRESRFGIEIDRDWIKKGDYHAIQGDAQRAVPMLVRLGVTFPRIVANPPFGLAWKAADGKTESSTAAAWRMCLALLAVDGIGAFIAGRDRLGREILDRPGANGIFAVIECPDLFPGVTVPPVIALYIHNDRRKPGGRVTATRTVDELGDADLLAELREALADACGSTVTRATEQTQPDGTWKLVHRELARRRREEATNRPQYDVELQSRNRLSVRPRAFVRKALADQDRLKLLDSLHNQPVGHFALHRLDWRLLQDLEVDCDLTIAPAIRDAVVSVTNRAEREVIPLYPLPAQMRLGYLTDLDSLHCIRPDTSRGFRKGRTYSLKTETRLNVTHGKKVTYNAAGEPVVRKYDHEARILLIKIAEHEFSESAADIKYILRHFEVPDPGDIGSRFPDEVEEQRQVLDTIAKEAKGTGDFRWRRFQREDLARGLVKALQGGGVLLSWEQGGGKTVGAAGFALACIQNGARNRVLFIAPQDLIVQYREDIKDKLGISVEHITTPVQARRVAKHLAAGGEGWYITHYEVLSLMGVKDEALPRRAFRTRNNNGKVVSLDSKEFCPSCHASNDEGWQENSRNVCAATSRDPGTGKERLCGYVHKGLRVKSAAHYLAHSFADGVICIDEGTLAKGDTTHRSRAIRGLQARHRILCTGTPIANYINQIFWLMWWTCGDSTLRFPYSYRGGLTRFEQTFCVIEYLYGPEGSDTENVRVSRKVLPRITNVSRFWRLGSAVIIRRRKVDFGETLVPLTLKTVRVPMGVEQQRLYSYWLDKDHFAEFFAWKYPNHRLVTTGQIKRFAAACGQLAKLEYATTAPAAATDQDWPGLAGFEHSNWTPKNLRTLEIVLEHVKKGEKVLVGSDLIGTGRWLCDRLQEKGVRAAHIVEERNGTAQTINPKKRARVMRDFRRGLTQVLLSGIPALRLGHNLDTASVVIIDGLVFSFEMYDQFINRVHRLTSVLPVTVYVMLTIGSLDEDKWQLLCAKAAAQDLALDGQLADEREDPVSLEQTLRTIQERGVPVTGKEIAEATIKAAWDAIPRIGFIALHPALITTGTRSLPPKPLTLKPITSSEQLALFT
jgi:predicted RNA methylase